MSSAIDELGKLSYSFFHLSLVKSALVFICSPNFDLSLSKTILNTLDVSSFKFPLISSKSLIDAKLSLYINLEPLFIFAELNTPSTPIKIIKIQITENTDTSFFFTLKFIKNFTLPLPFPFHNIFLEIFYITRLL